MKMKTSQPDFSVGNVRASFTFSLTEFE